MWHGQGMGSLSDASMAIHVKSEEHERAHIFFATPDKVQWDLLRPRCVAMLEQLQGATALIRSPIDVAVHPDACTLTV